jgi:iron complex outermembrane receptor protein
MTVITKKEFDLLGIQTINDLLNLIPGFHTYLAAHNEWIPTVRGYSSTTSSHVKFMIDGHSLNENMWGGMMAWSDYPLDRVKQVEVIRGTGSFLYGTSAFSAVINIITDPEENNKISGTVGEWGHRRIHSSAKFGKQDNEKKFWSNVALDYLEEEGDDLELPNGFYLGTPFEIGPITRNREKDRLGIYAQAGYGDFSLTVNHADLNQFWGEGLNNILTQEGIENRSQFSYVEAQYLLLLSEDSELKFKGGFDVNSQNYEGQVQPYGFTLGADINGDGVFEIWPAGAFTHTRLEVQSYNGEILWQRKLERHQWTVGTQYNPHSTNFGNI